MTKRQSAELELDPVTEFVDRVAVEISHHQAHFVKNMRRYRWARTIAILAAGAVPVLTPVTAVDRIWLGLLGAIAAATEAVIQLYRWRDSAVASMRTANSMEHLFNLYNTSTKPYDDDGDQVGQQFILDIERIRMGASDSFVGLWSEDKPPSAISGGGAKDAAPAQVVAAGAVDK